MQGKNSNVLSIKQGNNLSVLFYKIVCLFCVLSMMLLICFVIVRAYGVNKVDKGPREVLNPEIQKVRLTLASCKETKLEGNSTRELQIMC